MSLGEPREHYETVGVDERTRAAARREGAAHGTLVTADEQTAGRGRQGRGWATPRGRAIAASLVLREYDDLLPLRAGLAVADVAGPSALVKWPNDVWLDGQKVAGILVEARQDPGWAVLGIGVNVAVDPSTLPPDAAEVAGHARAWSPMTWRRRCRAPRGARAPPGRGSPVTLAALRERDALLGGPCDWQDGEGTGAGIDDDGALRVTLADGSTTTLSAGEVTLTQRNS